MINIQKLVGYADAGKNNLFFYFIIACSHMQPLMNESRTIDLDIQYQPIINTKTKFVRDLSLNDDGSTIYVNRLR